MHVSWAILSFWLTCFQCHGLCYAQTRAFFSILYAYIRFFWTLSQILLSISVCLSQTYSCTFSQLEIQDKCILLRYIRLICIGLILFTKATKMHRNSNNAIEKQRNQRGPVPFTLAVHLVLQHFDLPPHPGSCLNVFCRKQTGILYLFSDDWRSFHHCFLRLFTNF